MTIKKLSRGRVTSMAQVKTTVLRAPLFAPGRTSGGLTEPPRPYYAPAVHFDGAIVGSIDSLAASTTPQWTSAIVYRSAATDAGPVYVAGNYLAYVWLGGSADPHLDFLVAPEAAGSYSDAFDGIAGGPTVNVWHSLIVTTDQTTGDFKVFVDRADVTDIIQDMSPFPSIPVNGEGFFVGGDGQGSFGIFDAALIRVHPGVSLLSGGTIPAGTLDKIVTAENKPVDPAVLTAFLGAPGAVLLHGDAAAWGTNHGTGGAISWNILPVDIVGSPSD